MKLRHCYPVNHRPARLVERRQYYAALDFNRPIAWLRSKNDRAGNLLFSMDPGNETGYIRGKYRLKRGKLLNFTASDATELREMVLEYLPEDVYYDRNRYKDPDRCADCDRRGDGCWGCSELIGQELMIDIDPENIDCPNCGTLEDRVGSASMFKFCYICFRRAVEQTRALHKRLLLQGFKDLQIVYSGRGFHVYIEGRPAMLMSASERKDLATKLKGEGFAIDPWVTEGEARLARLPFTLNGMVSRICMPIEAEEIEELDFWHGKCFAPSFISAECIRKTAKCPREQERKREAEHEDR